MRSNPVVFLTASLLAFLLITTIGLFLLYVPLLSFVSIIAVLAALVLMFALGIQVGSQRPAELEQKPSAGSWADVPKLWVRGLLR